jgi:hypothetical protein
MEGALTAATTHSAPVVDKLFRLGADCFEADRADLIGKPVTSESLSRLALVCPHLVHPIHCVTRCRMRQAAASAVQLSYGFVFMRSLLVIRYPGLAAAQSDFVQLFVSGVSV